MKYITDFLKSRYSPFMLVQAIGAWFLGNMFGLQGQKLWILRGALLLLILIVGIIVHFFVLKRLKPEGEAEAPGGEGGGEAAGASDDIDVLIRDAEAKLASGQEKGVKLSNLPAIFLIGENSTAKTSTMVNSGLDPELLAGQVYQETNLVPTRAANLWYAHKAVFVEAAGRAVGDPNLWQKIAKKLQPRIGSVVGKVEAPRAALVMMETESLFRPGASESLAASARNLRARLGEISQTLGVNLPVYVLFTKADRIAFFAEYVRNLKNEESVQVFGATVPVANTRTGVYAEEETARLNGAFEQLFRQLADLRPMFLSRENDAQTLPAIYEFPREFRKLRPTLVQFLVDLCRPSQLTVSPFLRGFYFSGVRPVIINEMAPAPAMRRAPEAERQAAFGATSVFQVEGGRAQGFQSAAAPQVVGTRKVPQWLFLSQFFHHLLLADKVALGASAASTKTSGLRRILLASAAVLSLLYAILLLTSYSRNHALETNARDAARGIVAVDTGGGAQLASLQSLQRLETLRQSLAQLTGFERHGAPLSYHWGLYIGDRLYPEVRQLYFECFRRVLFGQTQATLLDTLRGLPATPGPDYQPTYETLKAYLITTSNHDKSTREFLSPVLLNRWSANRNVDAERMALAQKQFDFYSDELRIENPYSSNRDEPAVAKARDYLKQFEGIERVYAAMLGDAAKKGKPVRFQDPAGTVVDNYEVPAAFTKPGFEFMKAALRDPSKYFAGEEWVLGPQAPTKISTANLSQQLAARYYADYIKQWRAYMRAAQVVRYTSLPDASKKLVVLSANSSPLLNLFALASQNTDVDAPEVKNLFQPVQTVVPPSNGDRLIAPSNQPYMGALLKLQSSVEQVATGPQPVTDALAAPTLSAALDARTTTGQLAQSFTPDKDASDPNAHIDRKSQTLLEDPITSVQALLKGLGPAELNGKGKSFCTQYRSLMAKYPFNPGATVQATVAAVNGIFMKPDGALWAFFNSSLQKFLTKQGAQYIATPGSGVTITPAFLNFFNNAAGFSEAIYAGNAQDPHFTYTLKPIPSEGIQTVGLKLDGQTLSYSGADTAPKQFTWTGAGTHEAKATVKFGGGPDLAWSNNDGLWAVFQFFAKAETWTPAPGGNTLEWIIRIGKDPVKLPSGNNLTVRFQLDMGTEPPVFQKGYFSRMVCVGDVAHQ